MPLGELSVPSYLVPPSPVQRQQLDLEREQLKDRQRERASQQLMRAVGMAKMNKETQELIDQQVDPVTARKQAFLNNAHLIMPPNSDISHFITQDEAQEVRRDTATMLNNFRLLNLQRQENDLDERKRLHDQIFERQARELELKADKAKSDQERQALDGQVKMLELQRKASKDQIDAMDRELNRQQRAADSEANRVSREHIATETQQSKLASNKLYQDLDKKLAKAESELDALQKGPSTLAQGAAVIGTASRLPPSIANMPLNQWKTSLEKKKKEVEDLKKRIAKLREDIVGKTIPAVPGAVGDNTMPDSGEVKEISGYKVRVKGP